MSDTASANENFELLDLNPEWARDNGKSVRQRIELFGKKRLNTRPGALPLNMYESHQTFGERIQFETPSSDNSDENQSLGVLCYGPQWQPVGRVQRWK